MGLVIGIHVCRYLFGYMIPNMGQPGIANNRLGPNGRVWAKDHREKSPDFKFGRWTALLTDVITNTADTSAGLFNEIKMMRLLHPVVYKHGPVFRLEGACFRHRIATPSLLISSWIGRTVQTPSLKNNLLDRKPFFKNLGCLS